ncbi:hypothetical protein [Salmonella enterica]|uniref:hypothetical protein n=1 Tax=Salmonella enterica TaxID=28901 RepID=UPI000D57E923|nr:hypothetical protein [Salmonella enterica]PVO50883.1 hypothetical protein C4743_06075 [Salmonella enterica subsp. enterica serovar Newport]
MNENLLTQFPTYTVHQLPGIFVNGMNPESMTHDIDPSLIKMKKFKDNLQQGSNAEVFCIATQTKRPRFRFRVGQDLEMINPYNFDFEGIKGRARVVGEQRFYVRGMSFNGYVCQYSK